MLHIIFRHFPRSRVSKTGSEESLIGVIHESFPITASRQAIDKPLAFPCLFPLSILAFYIEYSDIAFLTQLTRRGLMRGFSE